MDWLWAVDNGNGNRRLTNVEQQNHEGNVEQEKTEKTELSIDMG